MEKFKVIAKTYRDSVALLIFLFIISLIVFAVGMVLLFSSPLFFTGLILFIIGIIFVVIIPVTLVSQQCRKDDAILYDSESEVFYVLTGQDYKKIKKDSIIKIKTLNSAYISSPGVFVPIPTKYGKIKFICEDKNVKSVEVENAPLYGM